jgi:molybdopterin biosynthesis enzyme
VQHCLVGSEMCIRDSSGPQGSHQLASTAMANGLAYVPDGNGLQAGEHVSVYLLG